MNNSIIQFAIKRDGQKVKFNDEKIKNAIQKAFIANGINNNKIFNQITTDVIKALEQEGKSVQKVEHIQDIVEKTIANDGYFAVAKEFILYRDKRTMERKKKERLFQKISSIIKITDRENANVGNSPSSKLLQISEESDREYAELYLTKEEVLKAMKENLIYPHDYSWMGVGTTTCVPDFEYTLLKDMNGKTFRVKFDFFNNLIEKYHDFVVESNNQEILDLELTKVRYQIYGRTGWTPLNKIMRRKINDGEKLYQLKIRKGVPLHLTENHKIPVIRDNKEILLTTKDVQIGDEIIRVNATTIKGHDKTENYVNTTLSTNRSSTNKIIDKNIVPYDRYVFDLETGEHWFTVNDYIVHNCTFIPLRKLLKNGFNTGHGYIRTPKRIKTASSLACIILQSNQNDQHGGQAFGWFDRDMAPYVTREYNWQVKKLKEDLENLGITNFDEKKIQKTAWENTEKETFQAMESLVFNLNSMHARAGAQVPFTSINIGTDTSKEARLVAKMLLLAYEKGLGKGEQPLFPNIIFKVKSGINFEPNTPNYDLLMLSLRVTSKRLFPNYVFEDSTLNRDFPEDVPVMGCRTRISWDRHKPADKQTCEGRGNISFTTINPVGIALKSKYHLKYTDKIEKAYTKLMAKYHIIIPQVYNSSKLIKIFFVELNKNVDIIIEQLLDRFAYQCKFTKQDFPFLMNGVWMDSDKLGKSDTVANAIKHGTLTIGFIGLAETLTCLVGKHHGEDNNADLLGIEIVKFLRKKADEAAETYDLNFSVLATPAEGLCQKLVAIDKEKYGEIKGVTDKAWYTNSFHVPVEYKISMFKKIEIEGKYHSYCNGGQISYIELKEAPVDNIEGMYGILKHMAINDMSYVAINFPVDRCPNCGYSGLIENDCPVCKTPSEEISRIRRITGYLAELSSFNHGKKEEVLHRVSHN